MWSRASFDNALPTIVRYVGLVLIVVLTVALLLGVAYEQVAPGFVPAAGCLLYKTLKAAVEEPDG